MGVRMENIKKSTYVLREKEARGEGTIRGERHLLACDLDAAVDDELVEEVGRPGCELAN